jgi:hypothetical protein
MADKCSLDGYRECFLRAANHLTRMNDNAQPIRDPMPEVIDRLERQTFIYGILWPGAMVLVAIVSIFVAFFRE